jgi:hypothetical protein
MWPPFPQQTGIPKQRHLLADLIRLAIQLDGDIFNTPSVAQQDADGVDPCR